MKKKITKESKKNRKISQSQYKVLKNSIDVSGVSLKVILYGMEHDCYEKSPYKNALIKAVAEKIPNYSIETMENLLLKLVDKKLEVETPVFIFKDKNKEIIAKFIDEATLFINKLAIENYFETDEIFEKIDEIFNKYNEKNNFLINLYKNWKIEYLVDPFKARENFEKQIDLIMN